MFEATGWLADVAAEKRSRPNNFRAPVATLGRLWKKPGLDRYLILASPDLIDRPTKRPRVETGIKWVRPEP